MQLREDTLLPWQRHTALWFCLLFVVAVLLPDQSQHCLRGDGGRRRHDDQRFSEQHELPEDVQVDKDRLETPAGQRFLSAEP